MSPSHNRRKWPAPWPPCVLTTTRWRSKTWTCPTTLCSKRDGRGPCLGGATQKEMVMEEMEEWCVILTEKLRSLKSMAKWLSDKSSIKLLKARVSNISLNVTCILLTFYPSLYHCTQTVKKCHLFLIVSTLTCEIKLWFFLLVKNESLLVLCHSPAGSEFIWNHSWRKWSVWSINRYSLRQDRMKCMRLNKNHN